MIDTDVARALIATAQSVCLLGVQTLISCISAGIAQTLGSLGSATSGRRPIWRAASQLDR